MNIVRRKGKGKAMRYRGQKAVNAMKEVGGKIAAAQRLAGSKIVNAVKNVGSGIGGFLGRLFGPHK